METEKVIEFVRLLKKELDKDNWGGIPYEVLWEVASPSLHLSDASEPAQLFYQAVERALLNWEKDNG